MTRALPILTVAALAVALVGCSSADDSPADPSATPGSDARECAVPGAISDSVSVAGDFNTAPTVEFAAPLAPEKTEVSVAIEGSGDPIAYGSLASVSFTLYNGTSGEMITTTDYAEEGIAEIPVDDVRYIVGLVRTIECATPGSRMVGVSPASDGFGDAGNQSMGVAPGDPLVFVVDVFGPVTISEPSAWTENVPEVTWNGNVPTVALTDTVPTELMATVLSEGDGATVAYGQTVTVNYQGVSYDTGEVFDESFTSQPATFATTGVVEGFAAGIVGQKVGSKVMVVMPPALGYGTDPAAHNLGGQTLLFVIEILSVS